MPRLLKFALSFVGVIVLVIVGAAMAAHLLVSRQDNQFLRDRIEASTRW